MSQDDIDFLATTQVKLS
jgi:hypothetical protein